MNIKKLKNKSRESVKIEKIFAEINASLNNAKKFVFGTPEYSRILYFQDTLRRFERDLLHETQLNSSESTRNALLTARDLRNVFEMIANEDVSYKDKNDEVNHFRDRARNSSLKASTKVALSTMAGVLLGLIPLMIVISLAVAVTPIALVGLGLSIGALITLPGIIYEQAKLHAYHRNPNYDRGEDLSVGLKELVRSSYSLFNQRAISNVELVAVRQAVELPALYSIGQG